MTTSWTHKPTGTVIERSTVDALITTYLNSPRPHARKAAWRQLHVIGVQLNDIIKDLEKRLARGHDILNESYDISREEVWFRWLAAHESASDALSEIRYRIVEKRPELVTHRKDVEMGVIV